jgi:hypothetical protein
VCHDDEVRLAIRLKQHRLLRPKRPQVLSGTGQFPIQKCAIFRKFKEIVGIARRQTVLYAAQAIPPIDAEIVAKGHLWMETSELSVQNQYHPGYFSLTRTMVKYKDYFP